MNKSYVRTRDRLETYFNRTASKTWEILTSDLPVSKVRARVRSGRDQMRKLLLSSLPEDLEGMRILDAGCGTGQISVELARRGAFVVGEDISDNLIKVANDRVPESLRHKVEFKSGDMLSNEHGMFDYVVAMDSLIHYCAQDIAIALSRLALNTKYSILFTVAPKTILLSSILVLGKFLPKSDRSPVLRPISHRGLNSYLRKIPVFNASHARILDRIQASFYVSEALIIEL